MSTAGVTLMFFLLLAGTNAASALTSVRLPPRAPVALGTQIRPDVYRFNICGIELDRLGIGRGPAAAAPPGELLVGFDNAVVRGASCHHHVGTAYVGAFRFDLSDLRGSIVSNATLRVSSRVTNVLPRTGIRRFSETCLMRLEVATRSWPTGESFIGVVADEIPSVRIPRGRVIALTSTIFPLSQTIDITPAMQHWMFGRRPNLGLVVKLRDQNITHINENTDSCTSYLSLSLEITIVRNP
ncbi:MAG TPA: hypothetical protein VIG56_04030 [Pseudolabrys sp.]